MNCFSFYGDCPKNLMHTEEVKNGKISKTYTHVHVCV